MSPKMGCDSSPEPGKSSGTDIPNKAGCRDPASSYFSVKARSSPRRGVQLLGNEFIQAGVMLWLLLTYQGPEM